MDFSFDTYMTEYYRNLLAGGGSAAGNLYAGNVLGNIFPGNILTGYVSSPYVCFAAALEKALEGGNDIQEGEDVSETVSENKNQAEEFLNQLRKSLQAQYRYPYSGAGMGYGTVDGPETGTPTEQRGNLAGRLAENRESRRQQRAAAEAYRKCKIE